MTREALESVLSYAPDPFAAMTALPRAAMRTARGNGRRPPPVSSPPVSAPRSSLPTFGEVSQAYIDMRIGIDGEDHKEIKCLRLRRETFIDIVDDKPVNEYTQYDMQEYIIAMKTWPANVTKRSAFSGMTTAEILEANCKLTERPLAIKTLKSYCSHIRTMFRFKMNELSCKAPFQGATFKYPKTAALPMPRAELTRNVVQTAFVIGVKSGFMDTAMMPPIALLSARRMGPLTFLRDTDIYEHDGLFLAQIGSIMKIGSIWTSVPVKTEESVGFFVLHSFFTDIGWTEWAIGRGADWLFPQAHDGIADPSKYESRLQNRQLKRAGARGMNQEVFHSFRGDGITDLRRVTELNARTAHLQSGHAFANVHDGYGHKTLLYEECLQIAQRPLPTGIDWSIFRDLDFDAMAAKRRRTGGHARTEMRDEATLQFHFAGWPQRLGRKQKAAIEAGRVRRVGQFFWEAPCTAGTQSCSAWRQGGARPPRP